MGVIKHPHATSPFSFIPLLSTSFTKSFIIANDIVVLVLCATEAHHDERVSERERSMCSCTSVCVHSVISAASIEVNVVWYECVLQGEERKWQLEINAQTNIRSNKHTIPTSCIQWPWPSKPIHNCPFGCFEMFLRCMRPIRLLGGSNGNASFVEWLYGT